MNEFRECQKVKSVNGIVGCIVKEKQALAAKSSCAASQMQVQTPFVQLGA